MSKSKLLIILFPIVLLFSCYSKNKMEKIYTEVFKLENNNEYQSALSLLDTVPSYNRDWNYYLNYGLCLRNQDVTFWSGLSIPYFLKAYKLNPNNYETTYFFAQTNRYIGVYNAAYDLFKKAETLPDIYNEFSLYYELSDVCIKLGKFDEALTYIEKCLEIETTSYLIMMKGIAVSYIESKDCLDVYFNEANLLNDDKTLMLHLYAKECVNYKKYDQAKTIYEKLIDENDNCSDYLSEIAFIYLVQSKNAEAFNYLKRAYKINHNDKECLKNLALYFYLEQNVQKAIDNANYYFRINTITTVEIQSLKDFEDKFYKELKEINEST